MCWPNKGDSVADWERLQLIKKRRKKEEEKKELSHHLELHAGLKPATDFCWDPMLGPRLFLPHHLHPVIPPLLLLLLFFLVSTLKFFIKGLANTVL